MTTRTKILIAIALGCLNTRQIATRLNIPLSTVNNYFFGSNFGTMFTNDDLVKWQPGKANTIQRGPNLGFYHRKGKIISAWRIERK